MSSTINMEKVVTFLSLDQHNCIFGLLVKPQPVNNGDNILRLSYDLFLVLFKRIDENIFV